MRIAIDAMGGDDGPGTIIDGALVAARHLQIGLLLAGDRSVIERELSRHPRAAALDLEILHTPESISMSETATAALGRKARAAVRLGALTVGGGAAPPGPPPAVLCASGATVEYRPQHLVQFALMGSPYASLARASRSPRVGLL